jgi:hypothetical protein
MNQKNNVYVIYNKKLDLYKFGVTELDINTKVYNYCTHNNLDLSEVNIIFSHYYSNGVEIELLLSKSIIGKKVKLPNSNYYYKEHFRKDQLENILSILESKKTKPTR